MSKPPDLTVNIGGLTLKNPVLTASGTFGYGREFETYVDLKRLGGIVVKGLSLEPSMGNKPPRIVETPCGMLNAIGLENVGIEAFIRDKLPFLQTLSTPILVNIYGQTVDAYARLAERIDALAPVAGIEVNISCPNVKAGGVAFGVDPDAAARVVRAVRKKTTKPLIVKLSPNVTDIAEIAVRVEAEGADSLSDQYHHRHGHRPGNPTPEIGECYRWTFRSGHQTGCLTHGLAGLPGGADPGPRHRRNHDSPGCTRIFYRRCRGGSGRNGKFRQSGRNHGHSGRHRELSV